MNLWGWQNGIGLGWRIQSTATSVLKLQIQPVWIGMAVCLRVGVHSDCNWTKQQHHVFLSSMSVDKPTFQQFSPLLPSSNFPFILDNSLQIITYFYFYPKTNCLTLQSPFIPRFSFSSKLFERVVFICYPSTLLLHSKLFPLQRSLHLHHSIRIAPVENTNNPVAKSNG